MIIVEKARQRNGVSIKGDFWDLDRLYFAIYKFTGFHGPDSKCTFPGYDAVCENLLGLCYEIRHAWQGDRNIEQVYNGIHKYWFEDIEKLASPGSSSPDDPDEIYDEDSNEEAGSLIYEINSRFPRGEFPDVTENNTYFSIPMTFPEAVFYSFILLELLRKKEIFLQLRKLSAQIKNDMVELNKEYFYFQANEDIARITIFVNQTLHTLYRFIGEKRYTALIEKFGNCEDFFLNCNLDFLNSILAEYGEKEYENDDPDNLFSILMSFFK